MKRKNFTILFAVALIIFFTNFSYSQKSPRSRVSAGKGIAQGYEKRIADYWDHRIVKCGDSSYLFRESKARERDLFEVKGITYETSGEASPHKQNTLSGIEYPRNVDWSGSSTARFESYRRFVSRGTWEDWKTGGAEFSYFRGYKGSLFPTPVWPIFTTCSEVESFKKKITAGTMLPDSITHINIKNIDGGSFTLADHNDKVILVNLWATWCGPCLLEMPGLIDIQNKYKDRGLIVLGLNADSEEGIELIKAFRQKHRLNYTLALANDELNSEFTAIAQATVVPLTFLIDKGRLAAVFRGYNPNESKIKMENTIERVLRDKK